jgi:hypothetical protein
MDPDEGVRLSVILGFLEKQHAHVFTRFEQNRRALIDLAEELGSATPRAWLEKEQARMARLYKDQRRLRHLERRIYSLKALMQVRQKFARTALRADRRTAQ